MGGRAAGRRGLENIVITIVVVYWAGRALWAGVLADRSFAGGMAMLMAEAFSQLSLAERRREAWKVKGQKKPSSEFMLHEGCRKLTVIQMGLNVFVPINERLLSELIGVYLDSVLIEPGFPL